MASIFNSVKINTQRKNKNDLSFASRLTTEFGRITPFLVQEVLPNDTFKIKSVFRCQFAPMKFPVMQRFNMFVYFDFVPRRLIQDDWEEFITRGEDGVTEIPYPEVAFTHTLLRDMEVDEDETNFMNPSSLLDYLGFPTLGAGATPSDVWTPLDEEDLTQCKTIDIMPFKAYQLLYNECFRDETLSQEVNLHTDASGIQNYTVSNKDILELFKLRNKAWRKDYFTSALPDPQRGPDVTLPLLGGDVSITSDSDLSVESDQIAQRGTQLDRSYNMQMHSSGGSRTFVSTEGDGDDFPDDADVKIKGKLARTEAEKLRLNLGSDGIRSATINEVRRAFAIQRWYELAARAGNRYIEQILAHFGIRSSDARLQRPEFLGGGVIPVNVGDILQTSESRSNGTPLGTPAGIAQAAGVIRLKKRKFTFEEHGYIIGTLCVVPEASYMQGMPRKYLRRSTFDFAWPLLANIGEQEIKKGELYWDWERDDTENMSGFGYTPRYAEYKFAHGEAHGDFRSSLLDFHDIRFFNNRPLLNQEFLEVRVDDRNPDTGLNRIFAVQQSSMADHLWISLYCDVKARRVLPKYGTPV